MQSAVRRQLRDGGGSDQPFHTNKYETSGRKACAVIHTGTTETETETETDRDTTWERHRQHLPRFFFHECLIVPVRLQTF